MRKRYIIHVIFLLGIFAACGTSKNGTPAMDQSQDRSREIYVDSATCGDTIATGEKLEVTVSGKLPSPAYTFDRFDVQVKGDVIEITPLAIYDPDKLAAQVLVPFVAVCRVENLEPGTYDLKIKGRTDLIVKKKHVKVKKTED